MDPFRAISVTLGLVIGLGVARLLSAGVSVFRSRETATIDWVPLVWAACIFLWQIQFWWAIVELPRYVSTWTLPEFAILLGMTLSLYIAAALALPPSEIVEGDSLAESFHRDGRWALIFLSMYFVLAIVVNWWMFDMSPIGYPASLNLGLVVLPWFYLALARRNQRVVVTLAYAALALWSAWEMSPHSYTSS